MILIDPPRINLCPCCGADLAKVDAHKSCTNCGGPTPHTAWLLSDRSKSEPKYTPSSSAWILLQSGAKFDFLDPDASDFTIEDIAHALSNTCRFGGHCSRFYSVAQHCVHASENVAPEHAMAALMHDASEAFCVDVPRPLKNLLPDYRTIENFVHKSVCQRMGVAYPFAPEIHAIDEAMLATEREQLMPFSEPWADLPEPLPILLPKWTPEAARDAFLDRFHELFWVNNRRARGGADR